MTTNTPPERTPSELPELPELPALSDEAMDRIEQAVFTQIADERVGARARAVARRRSRRRGWLTAGGIAAAFVVGVLITPTILNMSGTAGYSAFSGPAGIPAQESKSLAGTAGGAAPSASNDTSPATQRDIVRTATATLQVDDVRAAAEALQKLAEKHGGFLESEQIGSGQLPAPLDGGGDTGVVPPSRNDGWVTLRVPADDLSAVMEALRAQGTVLSTSIGQNDVTATTTDLRAQVASLTASVQRLTELMSQAASVADLLTAETALTDRQAQLQSAQQQLKDLESQVDMSWVQVTLVREAPAAADPAGFGDGLVAGWQGLIVSLNALVIAIGFLLPWLAVALVIALVVWAILRGRRARRTQRAAAVTESRPGSPATGGSVER